jgi:transcriptional regulator with XRE-family HTH domain
MDVFAARAELRRTYIGDIERGSRNISLINMGRIAKALELRVGDLMKRYDVDLP